MNKRIRLIASTVLFAAVLAGKVFFGLFSGTGSVWEFITYLFIYLLAGYDTVFESFEHIFHGELFDEDFLMLVASAGAFAIGSCSEAAAVMILFGVGEQFEDYASDRSERSVSELLDLAPHTAHVKDGDSVVETDAEKIVPGTLIVVKPGERIPLDSTVVSGHSTADNSPITGESRPVGIEPGSEVFAGCINGNGTLVCKTMKEYCDSAAARILEQVKEAAEKKSSPEKFITAFSKIYTPAVTGMALIAAVLGSVITGEVTEWIRRACTLLVISCPCALVISVPMTFFAGIGAASRKGILIKGSTYIGTAASLRSICFDKTGTLTCGELSVSCVVPYEGTEDDLLSAAAFVESDSTHPYARAILKEAERRDLLPKSRPDSVREIPGEGIEATAKGSKILAGNRKLIRMLPEDIVSSGDENSRVYVEADGRFLGYIGISDTVKPLAKATLKELEKLGIRTCMLTGDDRGAAAYVADVTGVNEYSYGLLPEDKVACLEEIMKKSGPSAFVGDGINDAPVLTRSDLGIAMGCLGSDSAVFAADIVLMDDDIGKIPLLISMSKGILSIVRTNIIFALSVKLVVLVLSFFGMTAMWLALFADVGVTVLATLNSMRALRLGNRRCSNLLILE